jgi:hypothetical protein
MTIRVLPMRQDEAASLVPPDERAGIGTLATRRCGRLWGCWRRPRRRIGTER